MNATGYVRRSTSILLVLFLCKTTTIKYPRDELLLLCEDLRIYYVKIYRFIDWSFHKKKFYCPNTFLGYKCFLKRDFRWVTQPKEEKRYIQLIKSN